MCSQNNRSRGPLPFGILVLVIGAVVGAATLTKDRWYPRLFPSQPQSILDKLEQHALEQGHDDHGAHAEGAVIQLSLQGLKNVGYQPLVIKPTDYERMLTLPAIVVERPGRSQLHIAAPLTGVVTKIHSVTGEAIEAGQVLFDMRLTHEELVAAQREYLRTSENLGVVNREITRLQSLEEGVIAGRRVLEKKYEKQKLEASLHAEAQAMLLHGLTEEQVDKIRETRRLFQAITIRAPEHNHAEGTRKSEHPFQIQQLSVAQGQQVEAGHQLIVLSDHCELLIEGLAFEDDAAKIRQATKAEHKAKARLLVADNANAEVSDLELLYVADQVDSESRAFKVYMRLPNKLVSDRSDPAGKRYVEWAFKPGQRMQLQVPVETWEDQLVVPTEAVVGDGADTYVYQQHGDHFDQVAVHVLHRDQNSVVIANDGALAVDSVIAGAGAYQIHLALKSQAGSGVDPHAGHSH